MSRHGIPYVVAILLTLAAVILLSAGARQTTSVPAEPCGPPYDPSWTVTLASVFYDTLGNRNNRLPVETGLYCASPTAPHGTVLEVTANGRSAVVPVLDYGPAKRIVRRGITLDLSPALMRWLGGRGRLRVAWRVLEVWRCADGGRRFLTTPPEDEHHPCPYCQSVGIVKENQCPKLNHR